MGWHCSPSALPRRTTAKRFSPMQSVFSLAARRRVSPEERKGQGIATVS